MSILQQTRCLENHINLENYDRLKFFLENKELLGEHAKSRPSKSKQKKDELSLIRAKHRSLQKELDELVEAHRTRREAPWRKERVADFSSYPTELQNPRAFDHPMYPVSEHMYDLLKVHKGTEVYLHERYKSISKDKFYLPYTTTHSYGWETPYRRTERFGSENSLIRALYRHRGVDKDPDWYRYITCSSPTVCNTASIS